MSWWTQPLDQLNVQQWEALCDGCGWCCLHKEMDDQGGVEIYDAACPLLNPQTGRCTNYPHRQKIIADCQQLTLDMLRQAYWLPQTCAYRLRANDLPLPHWHPLLGGDGPLSVGQSVVTIPVKPMEWTRKNARKARIVAYAEPQWKA